MMLISDAHNGGKKAIYSSRDALRYMCVLGHEPQLPGGMPMAVLLPVGCTGLLKQLLHIEGVCYIIWLSLV